MNFHQSSRALWISVLFSMLGQASAADFEYGLSAGIGHTDNVRLAPDEESETIGSIGANFGLSHQSLRLMTSGWGALEYQKYFDDTYSNDVIGNVNLAATFRFVPERFEWVVTENFGQIRTDPFAPSTPLNRENVNYLVTGPNLGVMLGGNTRMIVSGRYARADYETTEIDNDRVMASLGLRHSFTAVSAISLNVGNEKIDYRADPLTDFDRRQAYVRYELTGARTSVQLDGGYNQLVIDQQKKGGAMFALDLARQLSAFTRLTVRAGQEFSDSAGAFRLEQAAATPTTAPQGATADSNPFTTKYAGVGLDFARNRTGLGLSANIYDEAYVDAATGVDRRRWTTQVYVSRQVSPRTEVRLVGRFDDTSAESQTLGFSETQVAASLAWRASRRLTADLQYQWTRRNGESALDDSDENRIWLRLVYGTGIGGGTRPGAFDTAAQPGL